MKKVRINCVCSLCAFFFLFVNSSSGARFKKYIFPCSKSKKAKGSKVRTFENMLCFPYFQLFNNFEKISSFKVVLFLDYHPWKLTSHKTFLTDCILAKYIKLLWMDLLRFGTIFSKIYMNIVLKSVRWNSQLFNDMTGDEVNSFNLPNRYLTMIHR